MCFLPLLSGPRRLTCSLSCILVVGHSTVFLLFGIVLYSCCWTLRCILVVGHSNAFVALRGLLWSVYIQSGLNRSAYILVTGWKVLETFRLIFLFEKYKSLWCLQYMLIATLRGVHPSDIPLTLPDTCLRISLTRPNPRLLNILFKLKLNSPDLLNVFRPAFRIQIYAHRQVQDTYSA